MNRIAKIALAGAAFGLGCAMLQSCTTVVKHEKVIVHDGAAWHQPMPTFDCVDPSNYSECQDLLDADLPRRERI